MPPRPLSKHLALYAAGIGVPLVLLAGIVGWIEVREEGRNLDREAQRIVRDLTGNLERELEALAATARTLAIATALPRDQDFARFYEAAKAIPIHGGGWVVLWDRTGQQKVNTLLSWGTPLPRQTVPEVHEAVFERGETHVADPVVGAAAQRLVFSVWVPVRDASGAVAYGVGLIVPAEHLTNILREVSLPEGWVATVNDRKHNIAARNINPERWLGAPMSASARAVTEAVPPGTAGLWENVFTLEGEPVRGAFYRMSNGWLVSASALQEVYEAPLRRLLAVGAVFIAAFLAAAAAMASILARGILQGLAGLSRSAAALGQGEAVEIPPTPIREFNAVIEAIRDAAEELRRRDGHRALLVDELNHRVKNTLATVQALARRSFVGAAPELYRTFEGRLIALSGSHTLLTATSWSGASIRVVLEREVSPYGGRVTLDGVDAVIPAKVVLGLSTIAHELATNAAKHGALSTAEGRVDLSWTLEDGLLTVLWRESGGPVVLPPTTQGLGTRLIKTMAERELAGRIAIVYEPAGVRCELAIPLGENRSTYRASEAA